MKVVRLILCLMVLLSSMGMQAQESPNARQARRMFDEVYQKMMGGQGSTMHYKVNIASLYKTEGTIWYKGKKSRYLSKNKIKVRPATKARAQKRALPER